ncbi:hypothetical protein ACHAWO_004335 [Cyclotella atomus]|uniref:Uncharacterized protein n=1 Tax=Cyclotella atomus TaxID=382360 RepID=A0ABD3MSE7_9STRA
MIRPLIISSFTIQSVFAFSQCSINDPTYVYQSKFQSARQSALNARRSHTTKDFDTAYEYLAQDRHSQLPNSKPISWFRPADLERQTNPFHLEDVEIQYTSNQDKKLTKMPLYPCGEVHVPFACGNYTLNNIQERNVNMAKDLANNQWPSSLFCVALRAKDTNRIASTATVMQVLQMEDRSVPMHSKIVVTCKAVGIAQIVSIDNPQVWNDDYAGDEYLIANVDIRLNDSITDSESDGTTTTTSEKNHQYTSLANQLLSNYQSVKSIYSTSTTIASNELPPYALTAIQSSMPNYTISDILQPTKFWSVIDTLQTLCNTLRQAKFNILSSTINEMSVDMAMELLDGPLELPVKRHRLPKEAQWKLNEMEQRAFDDYWEMGMDPVLDFQMLMEMECHWERVEKVAMMVGGELERLEAKESLVRVFLEGEQSLMDRGDEVFG